jgi:hypothetical protein
VSVIVPETDPKHGVAAAAYRRRRAAPEMMFRLEIRPFISDSFL